jgi:voltage-gated potassium channel Kch
MPMATGPASPSSCGRQSLLTVTGALIWLAERRHNEEQFRRDPAAGIGNGIWWSAVTMTTVGYGDKAPVTLAGRVIALVWMFGLWECGRRHCFGGT